MLDQPFASLMDRMEQAVLHRTEKAAAPLEQFFVLWEPLSFMCCCQGLCLSNINLKERHLSFTSLTSQPQQLSTCTRMAVVAQLTNGNLPCSVTSHLV